MTVSHATKRSFRPVSRFPTGQLVFGLFGLFCLLLLLKNAELAVLYMTRGLLLCAKTIVPSLFPFLVLSELLVSGGAAKHLPRWIIRPLELVLGLDAQGCIAVLLGVLCGFPVGAKCVVLAYRNGAITKEEAERALCFSNNPSSAFLISAVGISLWGNRSFGVALYAVTISVSLGIGIVLSLLHRTKKERADPVRRDPLSSDMTPYISGAKLFTSSVRSATESMLLVCAYVVFFSTLVGSLQMILTRLSLPSALHAWLFCLFELSSGMSIASSLGNTQLAALLCAFAAGWGGLSVHCQILTVCDGYGFSFRRYAVAKLIQGLLCALIFGILTHASPELLIPTQISSGHF